MEHSNWFVNGEEKLEMVRNIKLVAELYVSDTDDELSFRLDTGQNQQQIRVSCPMLGEKPYFDWNLECWQLYQ